jgi:hypothetical protein
MDGLSSANPKINPPASAKMPSGKKIRGANVKSRIKISGA